MRAQRPKTSSTWAKVVSLAWRDSQLKNVPTSAGPTDPPPPSKHSPVAPPPWSLSSDSWLEITTSSPEGALLTALSESHLCLWLSCSWWCILLPPAPFLTFLIPLCYTNNTFHAFFVEWSKYRVCKWRAVVPRGSLGRQQPWSREKGNRVLWDDMRVGGLEGYQQAFKFPKDRWEAMREDNCICSQLPSPYSMICWVFPWIVSFSLYNKPVSR